MATSAERLEKARKVLTGGGEPQINPLNYRETLIVLLNWYNLEYDAKAMKSWFLAHCKRNKVKLAFDHNVLKDYEYRTIGKISRMMDTGQPLEQLELDTFTFEMKRLEREARSTKTSVTADNQDDSAQPTPVKTAVTPEQRIATRASEFLAEFDASIDEFITDRKAVPVQQLITGFSLTDKHGKVIAESLQGKIAELREVIAGKDKQLTEGYSNFTKPEVKKLLSFYETLIEKLGGLKRVVVRKPRVKKAKPASEVVKRLKYAKENKDLGLTSVLPTELVDSKEVWLYNTKYRKLSVYTAMDGMSITVKGTSLMNWDEKQSYSKVIRKPEGLKELKGKRSFSTFMKGIKAKQGVVNGRLNEETLILATFK